ncbi:MAG: putative Ig domain-containing protein [Steroidobacterales bacterium]
MKTSTYVLAVWATAGLLNGCASDDQPESGSGVEPPAANNHAPKISGAPPIAVVAGSGYSFTPAASDPDGNTLTFSIANKPSWATFDGKTGRLSGTPTTANVQTTTDVRIAVTDGKLWGSLPAFDLAVVAAAKSKSVTLAWLTPTEKADGTPLTNLAGYIIRYGSSPTSYTNNVRVNDAGIQHYTVDALEAGTWYFAIAAFDAASGTSSNSNQVIRTID